MDEGFIGEIRMFGGNFAPRGWALCQGQLLAISSNTALFSILGTTFGGDGRTTFGLPDLRGRVPIQQGSGPGLSSYSLGQHAGQESVTVSGDQMPSHSHAVGCTSENGNQDSPTGHRPAAEAVVGASVWGDQAASGTMAADMVQNTGGNGAHDNRQPYLAVNFIICLFGVYPSRN